MTWGPPDRFPMRIFAALVAVSFGAPAVTLALSLLFS